MTARLLMVAHAETAGMRRAEFADDEPLDARGLAAARALVRLRGDRAPTSPAPAARETALALGLEPAIDADLRNLDVGAWKGRALCDVAAADPAGVAAFTSEPSFAGHGGESIAELIVRVGRWLGAARGERGRIVAVTHTAVVRAAALVVLEAPAQAFWKVDIAPLRALAFVSDGRRWALRAGQPDDV